MRRFRKTVSVGAGIRLPINNRISRAVVYAVRFSAAVAVIHVTHAVRLIPSHLGRWRSCRQRSTTSGATGEVTRECCGQRQTDRPSASSFSRQSPCDSRKTLSHRAVCGLFRLRIRNGFLISTSGPCQKPQADTSMTRNCR